MRERKTGKRSPGLEVHTPLPLLRISLFFLLFFFYPFLPSPAPISSLDTPAIVCVRLVESYPCVHVRDSKLRRPLRGLRGATGHAKFRHTSGYARGLQFCDPATRFLSRKEERALSRDQISILNVWYREFVCEINFQSEK